MKKIVIWAVALWKTEVSLFWSIRHEAKKKWIRVLTLNVVHTLTTEAESKQSGNRVITPSLLSELLFLMAYVSGLRHIMWFMKDQCKSQRAAVRWCFTLHNLRTPRTPSSGNYNDGKTSNVRTRFSSNVRVMEFNPTVVSQNHQNPQRYFPFGKVESNGAVCFIGLSIKVSQFSYIMQPKLKNIQLTIKED